MPPLLFRRANTGIEVHRLEDGGPVLGLIPDVPYRQGRVSIEKDDVLLIFSDGITEIPNDADELYGEHRVIEAVRNSWSKSPDEIRAAVLTSLQSFAGTGPQDDQTLMVLQFTNAPTARILQYRSNRIATVCA